MSTMLIGIDVSLRFHHVQFMDRDGSHIESWMAPCPLFEIRVAKPRAERKVPNLRLKYDEVLKHKHKRALVLYARKLVRLVFMLLKTNKMYMPPEKRNH